MSNYRRNAFIYATIVAIGGFVFGLDAALIKESSYIRRRMEHGQWNRVGTSRGTGWNVRAGFYALYIAG